MRTSVKTAVNPSHRVYKEDGVFIDRDWAPIGVTEQFLGDADVYHEKYYNNNYWKYILNLAIESIQIDRNKNLDILDIGSGSGNTVFAALDLLINATVCASDISPSLLKILVEMQRTVPHLSGRISAYCFDVHKNFFRESAFDLIIGGAILHHLLDPEAALTNVAKWLRPGGHIILIEPQEMGAHIMSALYLRLLSELEDIASPRLLAFFRAMIQDYEARFGVPRVKPWTASLDDKWLFHPSYIRQVAAKVGLEFHSITPLNDLRTLFTDQVRGNLGLSGIPKEEFPNRMWEVTNEYDAGITTELKKHLAPEGIICLAKP